MSELKKKTILGLFWNLLEKISVRGTQLIISIILARILSPSDYGLIGMLSIFIGLSTIIIESGFVQALVQKKNCTEHDFSTVFFINILVSITLYVLLFLLAPYVAAFYNQPLLCKLLRVLSLDVVIASFNIVQRAKLIKSMDFKSLAKINFIGTIMGGIVGLLMAYWGCGVWALVGQSLSLTVVTSVLFPLFSKWKPRLLFSYTSFKNLFGYGSNLLLIGSLSMIINNITSICIGKAYSSSQLGYYSKAQQLATLLSGTLSDVIASVTFPVISSIQDDKEKLKILYKKALYYEALFIFPCMIMLALLAKPLVIILFTEKWLPCVPLLQIISLTVMFYPITGLNMNLINATGHSSLYRKLHYFKLPVGILVLFFTIPRGVDAVVIGDLIVTVLFIFVNAYYPKKIIGYGGWNQIKDWKYIILSLILMSLSVLVYLHFITNVWAQLIGGFFIAFIVYVLCSVFLFRTLNLKEVISLIRS